MVPILLALLLSAGQDPLEKKVASLVERLRSDEIERREEAAKEIVALGEPATPHLERLIEGAADVETAARLKAIIERIKRQALVHAAAPPARRVTVAAKNIPLREFLTDVCAQAGIEFTLDGAAGDRPVTIDAKDEPCLQVVDRVCAARGDLVATVADGRLRIAAGKSGLLPSGYSEAFRIRLRKTIVTEVAEGGVVKSSAVLYFDLDAQPDQKVRSSAATFPRAAVVPGGEIALKSATDAAKFAPWMAAGAGGIAPVLEGIPIPTDAGDAYDRICLIKDLPAGLKRIESLKVGGKFRFSVGWKPLTVPLTMRGQEKLPDIPYTVLFQGTQIYFLAANQTPMGGAPLEEFIAIDEIVLVAKDGTESKLSPNPRGGGMPGRQYLFQIEGKQFNAGEPPSLKLKVLDSFDRDVEFELKDVRLRD